MTEPYGGGSPTQPGAMPPAGTAGGNHGWTDRSGQADGPALTPVSPHPRRRGVSARWIVAALATIVVVVVAVGGFLLLDRSTGAPPASASYLPASTFMYSEFRFDLPGDQRERLGEFVSHFPGFEDRANLDQKVAQALDRLVQTATDQRYSYTNDIQPWFGGQVGVAVLDAPAAGAGMMTTGPGPAGGLDAVQVPAVLATLAVTDQAKARATLDRITSDLAAAGASVSTGTHNGTPTWTVTPSGGSAGSGPAATYALLPDMLVVGVRPDDVTAALDRRERPNETLASQPQFRDRVNGLRADRLGFMYLNGASYRDATLRQLEAMRSFFPLPTCITGPIRNFPDVIVSEVRVEGDRIVADSRGTLPQGVPAPAVRDSGLAGRVPAGSLAYLEFRDVGAGIAGCISGLKANAAAEGMRQEIDQAEQLLGSSVESFFEWIRDVAISVRMDGDVPSGGIVATVTDATTATQRVERIKALIQLAAGFGGGQIDVRDEDRNGVRVTTITLPRGAGGDLPAELSTISFALREDVFALGTGDFAATVFGQASDWSLGSDPRFSEAVSSVGGPSSASLMYLDIDGIRQAAEAVVSQPAAPEQAQAFAFYEREIRPYLLPFDRIVQLSGGDGQQQTNSFEFIVREPEDGE